MCGISTIYAQEKTMGSFFSVPGQKATLKAIFSSSILFAWRNRLPYSICNRFFNRKLKWDEANCTLRALKATFSFKVQTKPAVLCTCTPQRECQPLFRSKPFPRHELNHSIFLANTEAHLLDHTEKVTSYTCHKPSLILVSSLNWLLEYQISYRIQGFFELWKDQLLDIDSNSAHHTSNLMKVPLVYY